MLAPGAVAMQPRPLQSQQMLFNALNYLDSPRPNLYQAICGLVVVVILFKFV